MSDQSEDQEHVRTSGLVICPRCGLLGWMYTKSVGNREYVYVLHKLKSKSGKRKTKHCYLGPVGVYKHTYITNQLLLKGLIDPLRYLRYLDMILDRIEEFVGVENQEIREAVVKQLEKTEKRISDLRKRFEMSSHRETG